MKPWVEEHGDIVVVYYDRGFAEVYGSGRIYVTTDTGTTMHRSPEGLWSWADGWLVSGWAPEPVVDALARWSRTADGRAWIARNAL